VLVAHGGEILAKSNDVWQKESLIGERTKIGTM
jgi:hypothetical protein